MSDVCQENTGRDPAQERQEDQAPAQQGGPVLHRPRGLRGLHADPARQPGGAADQRLAGGFLLAGQSYPGPDQDAGQPPQPVRGGAPHLRDPAGLGGAGPRPGGRCEAVSQWRLVKY